MPVIGSNSVEGGFIKNQIDFVINNHWTGQAYLDYISNKGIGVGSRIHYDNYKNLSGSIYYYGVTDAYDNIKEWHQTIELAPQKTLSTHIQSKNMYLIQGGYSNTDTHSIKYEQVSDQATETTNYSFNQSNSSSINPQSIDFNYKKVADDKSSLAFNYKKSQSTIKNEYYTFSDERYIGYDFRTKNHITYTTNELSSTDSRNDSFLRTKNSISKLFDFGNINTTIDYYFDTDDDAVTRDIKNHIVQKTPEIDLTLNKFKLNNNWSINESLLYGYYSEYYYINSLDKQRTYSQSRMILNQNINGLYTFDLFNSSLKSTTDYTQYYYASGDENYTISQKTSLETDFFNALQTKTQHNRTWIPDDGNTPFYFDEKEQLEKNELKETIRLYLISPKKYYAQYESGYNWVNHYQLDNKMEIGLNPNKIFRSKFKTTYLHQLNKYTPLSSRFDITPNNYFNTSIQANYDLNEGEFINLNHLISGTIGSNWENRWTFKAYFTYSPKYEQDYQLQTLSLEKDLHCRKLTLMYNRMLEEYRFQFTINAFSDSNLGFTSNKYESFRLEGVFDDKSISR